MTLFPHFTLSTRPRCQRTGPNCSCLSVAGAERNELFRQIKTEAGKLTMVTILTLQTTFISILGFESVTFVLDDHHCDMVFKTRSIIMLFLTEIFC